MSKSVLCMGLSLVVVLTIMGVACGKIMRVTGAEDEGPHSMDVSPGFMGRSPSDPAGGSAVVIANVPAYNWYHGCGPTAAASIIGYYDVHGFGNLFDASGWNNVKLTANVQNQISSPAHNAKYDPDPDDPNLPTPPNTSIACWFRTSVNQPYGWSWLSDSDDAIRGYAEYRGYECTSWYESYGSFTWADLVGEIDANRPMMFLVDTDGNGGTDHFVPVLGYDDRGAEGLWYGCYTTWSESETIAWYRFRGMGNDWGVGYATFAVITPEPTMLVLIGIGTLTFMRRRRN